MLFFSKVCQQHPISSNPSSNLIYPSGIAQPRRVRTTEVINLNLRCAGVSSISRCVLNLPPSADICAHHEGPAHLVPPIKSPPLHALLPGWDIRGGFKSGPPAVGRFQDGLTLWYLVQILAGRLSTTQHPCVTFLGFWVHMQRRGIVARLRTARTACCIRTLNACAVDRTSWLIG